MSLLAILIVVAVVVLAVCLAVCLAVALIIWRRISPEPQFYRPENPPVDVEVLPASSPPPERREAAKENP